MLIPPRSPQDAQRPSRSPATEKHSGLELGLARVELHSPRIRAELQWDPTLLHLGPRKPEADAATRTDNEFTIDLSPQPNPALPYSHPSLPLSRWPAGAAGAERSIQILQRLPVDPPDSLAYIIYRIGEENIETQLGRWHHQHVKSAVRGGGAVTGEK